MKSSISWDFFGRPKFKDPTLVRRIITDWEYEGMGTYSVVEKMQEYIDGKWVTVEPPISGFAISVGILFFFGFIIWLSYYFQ